MTRAEIQGHTTIINRVAVELPLRDRLRVLLGAKLETVSEIVTAEPPGQITHTWSKVFVGADQRAATLRFWDGRAGRRDNP